MRTSGIVKATVIIVGVGIVIGIAAYKLFRRSAPQVVDEASGD